MNKKLLIFLLLLLALNNAKTLAKVEDKIITDDDLQARLDSMPSQYIPFYSSAEGKKKLLTQLVNEKLLYLQAKKNNYEKNTEVADLIAKASEEIITNYYLKKQMDNVSVSNKEIEDYYAGHKTDFSVNEQVRASHILVKTETEAAKIIQEIDAGKSFEELALAYSTCPSSKKGGDLDFFSKGQMVKPFEDAAFALSKDTISKTPVETQFGWHVIKVTDKKAGRQKELSEVRGEIRSILLQNKQKEKLDKLIEQAAAKHTVNTYTENL
jgi:peptidyl-prolyl cis-trans isomerase C